MLDYDVSQGTALEKAPSGHFFGRALEKGLFEASRMSGSGLGPRVKLQRRTTQLRSLMAPQGGAGG